jgi:hypothetical protein
MSSYAKMMKHWNKPRRHKMTKSRIRGNLLTHFLPSEIADLEKQGLVPKPPK